MKEVKYLPWDDIMKLHPDDHSTIAEYVAKYPGAKFKIYRPPNGGELEMHLEQDSPYKSRIDPNAKPNKYATDFETAARYNSRMGDAAESAWEKERK